MLNRELSKSIETFYAEMSQVFSDFQQKSMLACPPGCGQCCFKPDICCSPFELLPLALHLLDVGLAEFFLEKARDQKDGRCPLLEIEDEKSGKGRCTQYAYRPFICRAFGVSARYGKMSKIDYSICRVLKLNNEHSAALTHAYDEVPFIEIWRKKFEVLNPHLQEREIPINQALAIVLEKVLIWNSYQIASSPDDTYFSI
jgi:Fe-S-cluster containining protein